MNLSQREKALVDFLIERKERTYQELNQVVSDDHLIEVYGEFGLAVYNYMVETGFIKNNLTVDSGTEVISHPLVAEIIGALYQVRNEFNDESEQIPWVTFTNKDTEDFSDNTFGEKVYKAIEKYQEGKEMKQYIVTFKNYDREEFVIVDGDSIETAISEHLEYGNYEVDDIRIGEYKEVEAEIEIKNKPNVSIDEPYEDEEVEYELFYENRSEGTFFSISEVQEEIEELIEDSDYETDEDSWYIEKRVKRTGGADIENEKEVNVYIPTPRDIAKKIAQKVVQR